MLNGAHLDAPLRSQELIQQLRKAFVVRRGECSNCTYCHQLMKCFVKVLGLEWFDPLRDEGGLLLLGKTWGALRAWRLDGLCPLPKLFRSIIADSSVIYDTSVFFRVTSYCTSWT